MDGLGCIIYRWKALLNLYTVVVTAWQGTQEYPSNGPNKVATFCENEIHHIFINTACNTLNKNAFSSSRISLYDGILLMSIDALVISKQSKRYLFHLISLTWVSSTADLQRSDQADISQLYNRYTKTASDLQGIIQQYCATVSNNTAITKVKS